MVEVVDSACDECPVKRFLVTDACRGCIAHRCQTVCPVGAISTSGCQSNGKLVAENRGYFKSRDIYVANLMGSPGSGNTSLISAVNKALPNISIGVIEGDIASSIDKERLGNEGVKSVQINTCGECHLDAKVIRDGAEMLDMREAIVFIENVGNLICPAVFDFGEDLRLLAASVLEGDDKPFKYVPMFSYADTVANPKSDLIEAVGYDIQNFNKGLRAVSEAKVFKISCKTGTGVNEIAAYLKQKYDSLVTRN